MTPHTLLGNPKKCHLEGVSFRGGGETGYNTVRLYTDQMAKGRCYIIYKKTMDHFTVVLLLLYQQHRDRFDSFLIDEQLLVVVLETMASCLFFNRLRSTNNLYSARRYNHDAISFDKIRNIGKRDPVSVLFLLYCDCSFSGRIFLLLYRRFIIFVRISLCLYSSGGSF